MPWARLDDRFPSNRKIRKLSDKAFRLYVSAICWSAENLTDGFVPEEDLRLVADIRGPKTAAAELVKAGLWTRCEPVDDAVESSSCRTRDEFASSSRHVRASVADADISPTQPGWRIHDFHEYQPSAAQVKADREAKSARQQRWRQKKKAADNPPEPPPNTPHVDASTDASRDAPGDAAPRARVPGPARPDPTPMGGEGVCPPTGSSARTHGQAHTPIPPNFQPSNDSTAWAEREGHTTRLGGPDGLARVTAAFTDWHTAKGTRAADPDALWRKWIREQRAPVAPATQGAFLVGLPGGDPAPRQPMTKSQQQRAALAAAREQARREGKIS